MARTGRPVTTPRVTVRCTGCGASFSKRVTEVERSKTKRFFCGADCPGWAPKPRRGENRACTVCGKAFYARPSYHQTTCSNACMGKAKRIQREEVSCATCGILFSRRPKEQRRFCSAACAGIERMSRVAVACESCGEETLIRESELAARRFCSRACFFAHQTANAQGSVTQDGYRVVCVDGKLFKEHRLVMERILERPLRVNENVHHKNGVKADNNPENLELWVTSQPSGQRPADLVAYAREILDRYAAEVEAHPDIMGG